MSRRRIAKALTFLLLAVLLGLFLRERQGAPRHGRDKPEAVIWQMVNAAQASEPEKYLDCYTGPIQQSLRRNYEDMGRDKFDDYVSTSLREVKGIVVSDRRPLSADEQLISIEYVYQDRNEIQEIYVRNMNNRWKIFRVDAAERVNTPVPYGTRER